MTSTNGNPYEVSSIAQNSSLLSTPPTTLTSTESWAVDWITGSWNTRRYPGHGVYPVLKEYSLYDSHGVIWQWVLEVYHAVPGWWQFCDKMGDCYRLLVVRGYWHAVRYNSREPAIREVRLSRVG